MKKIITILLAIIMLVMSGCLQKSSLPKEKKKAALPQHVEIEEPLPWDEKPKFVRAQREAGTPLLIASYHASLPDPILEERYNISLGAEYVKGIQVRAQEIFSLNKRLGRRTSQRGFRAGPMYQGNKVVPSIGGGVCKIASVMYNVAILANQKIVERHHHSMTVPYVPPGQDATISWNARDFKFKNVTGGPILIWSEAIGETLYIAFYGITKPPKVTWEHKILQRTKLVTEYIHDPSLPSGTKKIVAEGSEGIVVHSWVVVNYPDGNRERKDLGISTYRAAPRMIAVGK